MRGVQATTARRAAVARHLRKLRAPRWRVLHAVPLGDGTAIDHVVIGPPGVFTLHTTHRPSRRVRVGAHAALVTHVDAGDLHRARIAAAVASHLLGAAHPLPVTVRPVIVVEARRLDIAQQPPGVHVVTARAVVRWLRRQQAILDAGDVAAIAEHARRGVP